MSSPSIPGKMEAKPLFNVQKALVQPVQMCMLDIPLSVQDDDVSRRLGDTVGVRGAAGGRDPTPAPAGGAELVVAKLTMPRAGTASRCDRFLSRVPCPEAGCGACQIQGTKTNGGVWEAGEAFLVLWLRAKGRVCCACPGSAARESLGSWWLPCLLSLSLSPPVGFGPALLQLQGLVHHAKIGVDCSIEGGRAFPMWVRGFLLRAPLATFPLPLSETHPESDCAWGTLG